MKKETTLFDGKLIVDLVCCLLGSCGFCCALLPALGQEAGVMDCLLFVAVDLSLIFLLSRRWWITPLLAGVLALAGFWAAYLFRLRGPIIEYVRGFIEWYSAACPYTLPYSENGSLFLVHLVFSLPVTLFLYLYFRKFSFLPLWIVLSGALLVWMQLSGAANRLAAAALLLITAFVLIARTNGRSINRKLGAGGRLPTAAMQLTALALAPLAVLFAVAIGPKADGAWRSEGLVNLVQDIRDILSYYGDGSSGSGSFDLSYSGLAPNGTWLGGDIDPDNRTVMRVKTDTPMLLAGAVYEDYNGYGWYDAEALGSFRFSSPLWRGKRREVFNVGKPSSGRAAQLYAKVSRVASLEISMSRRLRALFSGGKMEGVEMPYFGDASDVYFNSQGELYTLAMPDISMSYTIRTRVIARDREDFDENMRQLMRIAASGRDREYEEICRRCTQVSDMVEPFVRDLAGEITAGCDNDYDRALALEKWIGENCRYTRTPGNAREDRDFVSYFLETREGYCTYYASAMTIMARTLGIPARYVTGYGLKQADKRPNTVNYIATNATAHAWSQLYFYGIGWVDFDPTSWNFYEPVETDPPIVRETKPVEVPEIPKLEDLEIPKPEDHEDSETPEETEAPRGSRTGRILMIVLLCDLGAFLLFLLVRFLLLFFRMESFYYRLSRRYPDNALRADACYRQILKQLGFLGLEMEPSDTIMTFCERAGKALGRERVHDPLVKVCEPVMLSRFAMREPTNGELRRMCDFYIYMERELRRVLGIRKYILHRMILGR